jgi:octopine/nopaline transport system substrate-binding protein
MPMTIRRSTFLAGAFGLGAAVLGAPRVAQAKTWTKIVVATEGGYPPYNMSSPSGALIGFEPELLQEISRRIKIPCEMIAQNWDGIIPGLNDGKFDAIMSGMSITPKREETIAFSVPYSNAGSTFSVMKDSSLGKLPGEGTRIMLGDEAARQAPFAALNKALAGKTLGVQIATIQLDVVNAYMKEGINLRTYPTTGDSMLDLRAGRVDAVLASTVNLLSVAEKSRGEILLTGPILVGGLLGRGAGIGLRKTDTDLKVLFDGALAELRRDGTLERLIMKWFKVNIMPAE